MHILAECYALLVNGSVHTKLEACTTIWYVQRLSHIHVYIEKSPVHTNRRARSARQLFLRHMKVPTASTQQLGHPKIS